MDEIRSLVVDAVETPLSSAVYTTIRGDAGGPFRIPARGGARALVLVTWDVGSSPITSDGVLVLYGVAGSHRIALAVAHFDSGTTAITIPAFAVGGLPVDHYEIDGASATSGVVVRVSALVSASAGSGIETLVHSVVTKRESATDLLTSTISGLARGFIPVSQARGIGGSRFTAITPDDAADLARTPTDGVYVGVAGNIKFTDAGGSNVTLTNLAAGQIHPIQAVRIWSTDTTATGIFAVYGR